MAEVAAAVAEPAAPMSLREHIAAEEPAKALPGAPPPAPAAPAAVEDTPDPEVVADPELAKAIDELEAPKPEETPQEKAARTRKNKEAARKGLVSRLANQRDKERERAATAERELAELRRSTPAPAAAPAAPQPARAAQPVYDGTHPDDPEPTLDAFGDKPDPFVAWSAARADWAARREVRKAHVAGRQASLAASADAKRVDQLKAFDTHATEIRKTDPGFDARIAPLNLTGPMCAVIFGSGELGPYLADALAKDPVAYQRIVALPAQAQFVELGALKATVQASRKAPAAPEPVTQAPPPPSATAGGAAAAATIDTTRPGTSTKDHIAVEEAEIAERRKRGYRY